MIESKGYKITPIDGDLAVSRNAEVGGDVDIHGKARVAGSLKVEGFLDAPNIKGVVKGLFATEEELKREYPNPRPGWCAIVLADDERGFLYLAKNREWKKQSEEAKPFDFIVDSINVFASKGEIEEAKQELSEAIRLNLDDINAETNRATEAENEIKAKALKADTVHAEVVSDFVKILGKTLDGNGMMNVLIPAATETKAGVVSAEDKKNFIKSITWNNDTDQSNMNDFVVAGVYDIKGERTRGNDNLPILNTGGGHTFHARLEVLDSSITGDGKNDDKCITQVMSFNNRLGQGEVYIRTGKGISLDNLTWENWSTLQRNVNVGEVTSLDHLVDNGIYSGVYVGTGRKFTFVMVVVNDYLLAGNLGVEKTINQFLYAVEVGGYVRYSSRKKIGHAHWSTEEILNKDEINLMITEASSKLTDYINSTVADAKKDILEGIDPNKIDSIKDIVDWIDAHGGDVTAIYNNIQQNTVKINAEISRAKEAEQAINDKLDEEVGRAEQTEQAIDDKIDEEISRATEAEGKINQNTIAADSLGCSTTTDDISIEYETLDGKSHGSITFPAATAEKAGVMTSDDKKAIIKVNGVLYNNSLVGNDNTVFDNSVVSTGDIVVFEVDKVYTQGGITLQTDGGTNQTISFESTNFKEVTIPSNFIKAVSTWHPNFQSLKVTRKGNITEELTELSNIVTELENEQKLLPNLTTTTKNLADPNLQMFGYVRSVQSIGNNVAFGNTDSVNYVNSGYITLESNTSYAISFDIGTVTDASVLVACFCDSNKKVIEQFFLKNNVYTTPDDCKYIIFTIKFNNKEIKNIQIEKGNSFTSYVPFNYSYWGYETLPYDIEKSVEETKKIPKIATSISGIIYEGAVKTDDVKLFDNTVVSDGDIVIFETDKLYGNGAIDLKDLEGATISTITFINSNKREVTIPNNFYKATTKWSPNFQSLLITLKNSIASSLNDLEVGLDLVEKKVEECKNVTQFITIANSDKIGFFSNSFLNGYCIKGKHALDNLSMWSDYLFYNYGKSGDHALNCLDRINSNQKWLGDVPVQEWGITYGVIAMQDNDGGLYNADKETYYENFKKVAEAIKAMGAIPILSTEHDSNYFYYGLNKLANEQGYMFMNWGKVALSLYNKIFAPFWYNGHPATRTHWLWTYGMKQYLDTLPRPRKSIKLFRIRHNINTNNLQNLIYTDNISRAQRFIEIENGASVLTDATEKYFDRLNVGGSYTSVKSEYQTIQAKTTSISMGAYALIECITPYDTTNIRSLIMNIDSTGITKAYIKKNVGLENPLPSGSYIAFGVTTGVEKLTPGTSFTVTGGVFNDNILGNYIVENVIDNVVITTTSSNGKTTSGTDNPIINITGVTLSGSFKYPTAEYLQRIKQPLGEWMQVPFSNKVSLSNTLSQCMNFDKVSILLCGDNITISDLFFEVEGVCEKSSYSTNLITAHKGESLITDSLLDDNTSWESISDFEKYIPVIDPVNDATESLPKEISTVRILQTGNVLSQPLKTSLLSNTWGNLKLQVRVIARYFPDYVYDDTKWANSVIKQGSYDCATMSVKIGDNATTATAEVGLYWNQFIFDIDYFGGDRINILCENKSLQIAKVEVVLL